MKFKIFFFGILLLISYGCASYDSLSRNGNRVIEHRDLKWGINGHSLKPDFSGYKNQYNKLTFDRQISFLNELNVDVFRFEIHADEDGIWNEKDEDLEELILKLRYENIEPLVIIFTNLWRERYAHEIYDKPVEIGDDWDYSQIIKIVEDKEKIENIQNYSVWKIYYQRAFDAGNKLALRHGKNIQYYNVGNEMARYLVSHFKIPECEATPPDWSKIRECFNQQVGMGDEYLQFFFSEEIAMRFISLSAYTKGFIDGIKVNDQDAKIIINDTEMYYGYIQFLELLNVNYDIIGWNWYSGLGSIQNNHQNVNVYQKLVELAGGKDIWITEFNSLLGSFYGDERQKINIESMIHEYVNLDEIKTIILYELIDQYYGQVETPYEDYFGLITAPFPNENNAELKPSFNQYKYLIEEHKFGNQDYIFSLYTDMFKKSPSEIELNFWVEKFIELNNEEDLINEMSRKALLSEDELISFPKMQIEDYISNQFKELLNREPTKREFKTIKREIKKSQYPIDLSIKILTSYEYWNQSIREGYDRRKSTN